MKARIRKRQQFRTSGVENRRSETSVDRGSNRHSLSILEQLPFARRNMTELLATFQPRR